MAPGEDHPWPKPCPDTWVVSRSVRVVRYDEDGHTPVLVEYEVLDGEGTLWRTQRNLRTGELSHCHLPGDR